MTHQQPQKVSEFLRGRGFTHSSLKVRGATGSYNMTWRKPLSDNSPYYVVTVVLIRFEVTQTNKIAGKTEEEEEEKRTHLKLLASITTPKLSGFLLKTQRNIQQERDFPDV